VIRSQWEEGKIYRVPSYMYNKKKKWVKMFNQEKIDVCDTTDDLRVVTYNIWFEDHFSETRYQVIMKMIKES
jgi:hypothetical protein